MDKRFLYGIGALVAGYAGIKMVKKESFSADGESARKTCKMCGDDLDHPLDIKKGLCYWHQPENKEEIRRMDEEDANLGIERVETRLAKGAESSDSETPHKEPIVVQFGNGQKIHFVTFWWREYNSMFPHMKEGFQPSSCGVENRYNVHGVNEYDNLTIDNVDCKKCLTRIQWLRERGVRLDAESSGSNYCDFCKTFKLSNEEMIFGNDGMLGCISCHKEGKFSAEASDECDCNGQGSLGCGNDYCCVCGADWKEPHESDCNYGKSFGAENGPLSRCHSFKTCGGYADEGLSLCWPCQGLVADAKNSFSAKDSRNWIAPNSGKEHCSQCGSFNTHFVGNILVCENRGCLHQQSKSAESFGAENETFNNPLNRNTSMEADSKVDCSNLTDDMRHHDWKVVDVYSHNGGELHSFEMVCQDCGNKAVLKPEEGLIGFAHYKGANSYPTYPDFVKLQ